MQNKISKMFSVIAILAMMFAIAPGGVTQVQAAAPLLEENFDYGGTAGNLTATTVNWAAHSAGGTNPIQYVTSGLTMASYASSGVGGAVTVTTSGEDDNRTFTSQSSGPLYLAALVNLSSGQTTGDYFLHFKTSGTTFAARVFARNSSGNLQFGIGTSSTPVWSTTNFSFGTTYLVVAKHNMTTGVSDIYVLTSCESTEPVTPLATATGTAATPLVGVAIRQGSSSNAPAGTIDGIRVATNWTDAAMCVAAPTPNLSINDVTQSEGDAGTSTFQFTVSLSSPAPVGGVTFDISTADNSATVADNDYVASSLLTQTIAAGNSTYAFNVTVNGDTNVEGNDTFVVDVTNVTGTGVTVTDGQGLGTITNDDISTVMIHDVQGSGSASPIIASTVTVEAIVVGDYQTQGSGQLKGFFIQEEDADADADPATSEGLFIYCDTCPTAVSLGDKVQVTGVISEFNNMTEITASTAGSVVVVSTGNPLPTAASITIPVPGVPTGDLAVATAFINAYYEPFEGMLVTFPATLTVSEYFELARYGQVELLANGRAHTFTAANVPTALGYINHQIDLASRAVILDDMDNRQNRAIDVPNTAYFYPTPGFSTSNYFRGGDTITGMTGLLDWYASAWRIRPVNGYSYTFTPANPRPAAPAPSGRLTVASFNVLNYFLTLDTTSSSSSGPCGPLATLDCRGADNATELTRQRTKMLLALSAIDADVFGFMEMENTTGVEPLADIVAGLPGYDYIDTGVIGGDAIRVGIIYKTATVVPVGSYVILDSSVNPLFDDSRNRPALAQTFEEIATGERFTVVVNHLKSKGSSCGSGDDDTTTGQGNCNLTRTNAANALATWLATDPTSSGDPDFLIIGDLNSYAKEAPIVALQTAGYTDLVNLFGGASAYGYVFDGQLGYLDHALANASLVPQVAGVTEWHINADENPLFDYNDDTKDTGESSFEEESDVTTLYSADPYRTSDHDPVIISLDLDATAPVVTVPANMTVEATSASGATVNFSASALDNVDGPLTPTCVPPSGSTFALGTTPVTCSATDAAGNTGYGYFNVTVQDTTDPTLHLPANITVPQTIPAGAAVSYIVTATDAVDASPTVVCAPLSGSIFPVGTTPVNCSATDDYSNTANGSFNVTVIAWTAGTFTSVSGYDGFLLELNQNSGTGGTGNAFAGTLNIGDSLLKQQQLGLLHFDTSSLPDAAVILGISIQMKLQGTTGTNPFTTHGDLLVDIASPFFGTLVNLQAADFQATPGMAGVGTFNPVPLADNWYNADLGGAAFPFLNLGGPTQFRIGFSLDDDNDSVADLLKFYSGNSLTTVYRPVLIVYYYIP